MCVWGGGGGRGAGGVMSGVRLWKGKLPRAVLWHAAAGTPAALRLAQPVGAVRHRPHTAGCPPRAAALPLWRQRRRRERCACACP